MDMLKEYIRMCMKENCLECPISVKAKFYDSCQDWIIDYYDEAVSIIQKWAEEHPQKTYAQDFLEKFPKAPKEDNGELCACVRDVYAVKCPGMTNGVSSCKDCWNRTMEE